MRKGENLASALPFSIPQTPGSPLSFGEREKNAR